MCCKCFLFDLQIYFVKKIIYRVRYIADSSIFCGGIENRCQILLELEGVNRSNKETWLRAIAIGQHVPLSEEGIVSYQMQLGVIAQCQCELCIIFLCWSICLFIPSMYLRSFSFLDKDPIIVVGSLRYVSCSKWPSGLSVCC